jgi:hypothetical protein
LVTTGASTTTEVPIDPFLERPQVSVSHEDKHLIDIVIMKSDL